MHSLASSCFLTKLKTRGRTKYKGEPKRGSREPYIYVRMTKRVCRWMDESGIELGSKSNSITQIPQNTSLLAINLVLSFENL